MSRCGVWPRGRIRWRSWRRRHRRSWRPRRAWGRDRRRRRKLAGRMGERASEDHGVDPSGTRSPVRAPDPRGPVRPGVPGLGAGLPAGLADGYGPTVHQPGGQVGGAPRAVAGRPGVSGRDGPSQADGSGADGGGRTACSGMRGRNRPKQVEGMPRNQPTAIAGIHS